MSDLNNKMTVAVLRDYVTWMRAGKSAPPVFGPISLGQLLDDIDSKGPDAKIEALSTQVSTLIASVKLLKSEIQALVVKGENKQ